MGRIRHPTVAVPDVCPMDHAWDALGEWKVELEPEVERTDAGGGALAWMMHASSVNWELRTIFWPGDLHMVILDAADDAELFKVRGHRSREYYRRKYP